MGWAETLATPDFMTKDDFKAARVSLGLTQPQMADALRLGSNGLRAIRRWETGETPISGPVSLAVECLLKHRDPSG